VVVVVPLDGGTCTTAVCNCLYTLSDSTACATSCGCTAASGGNKLEVHHAPPPEPDPVFESVEPSPRMWPRGRVLVDDYVRKNKYHLNSQLVVNKHETQWMKHVGLPKRSQTARRHKQERIS